MGRNKVTPVILDYIYSSLPDCQIKKVEKELLTDEDLYQLVIELFLLIGEKGWSKKEAIRFLNQAKKWNPIIPAL